MLTIDMSCVFMRSTDMFRSVVMSSTPVLATSMAMSPMWLSCNHWRISPNPMTSLRFVKWVGTVCMCNVRARVMGGGMIS